MLIKPLVPYDKNKPLHIVFFSSGGPGNLNAVLDLEKRMPGKIKLGLIVTDRDSIPAITVAKQHSIPFLVHDYVSFCKQNAPVDFHDTVLESILQFENKVHWPFDLAVLAYRRIINGALFNYFDGKMINQHPADLSILDDINIRKYTGISGLKKSIQSGHKSTRTSTILVRKGVDNGEILCQGPRVIFSGDPNNGEDINTHEILQKKMSDWPSLQFVVEEIAHGHYAISEAEHQDGCKIILYKNKFLPYVGIQL